MLYFFLSYARGDDDVYVERFFHDLCAEVRVLTGEGRDEEVGFLVSHGIEPGQRWSETLVDALAECRSFLALCSPAYFLSEPCGREWAIFQERSRLFEQSTGTPATALIPLLWVPTRTMPAVAQTIQYTSDMFGEAYERGGLRQLLRLQRNRDSYLEFVSAVAERIVDTAISAPVPPLPEHPNLLDVPSAFHTRTGAGPAEPSSRPGSVVPSSQFVHFVVAAPTRTEAAAIRTDVRYYGDRPQDWAPFRPALDRPLGEYACRVAAERSFQSTVASVEGLDERLTMARRANQIVVMLIDLWCLQLDRYRRPLRAFDERDEPTTAVMIPWNDDDETELSSRALANQLSVRMPNHLARRDEMMFRSRVLTHEAFAADLQVLLEVARNRLFALGRVYRLPARPVLDGP